MKLGELFCGAGGFAEGAKQAGFKHVWGVDNHKDSCSSFEKNQGCKSFDQEIKDFSKLSSLKKLKKNSEILMVYYLDFRATILV